jgi:hypothetical protein
VPVFKLILYYKNQLSQEAYPMKVSNETKVGALTVIAVTLIIIGFNVRPWVDPATLTPRAKLAKRIVEPKQQKSNQATNERGVPYWEVYEKETGHVVHTFLSDDLPDAVTDAYNWLTSVGAEQPDLFKVRPKMTATDQQQSADDRQDSAHLQANLTRAGNIQDINIDVAQNFAPQDATQRSGSWAIYDVTLGREISRMDNVPWQRASDRAEELERSTGHNMSVRGLSETIDPVSGLRANNPVVTTAAPQKQIKVNPATPAVRVDVDKRKEDPLAQTYKRPVGENFIDGKGPGRPGDSQRHGIPKGASIAQLEKAAKAPGRKGELARWQLNMRRGKKK